MQVCQRPELEAMGVGPLTVPHIVAMAFHFQSRRVDTSVVVALVSALRAYYQWSH